MSLSTLTIKDVANAYQLSERSIYRMVTNGDLPAYKIGRSLRFKPADVERAMKRIKVYVGADRDE